MNRGRGFFAAAAVFLVLAAVFSFALVGYLASALCCVFAAAVCAFFGHMRRLDTKAAKALSIIGIAGLAGLALLFLSAEIPILSDMRSDADTDADYAIVFGAGLRGEEPSVSLEDRLLAACDWLEAHPDAVAVVSGSKGEGEVISEAQAMYNWLIAHGISPARIVMEEQAGSSYENLVYSLALIEDMGGDPHGRVALISSEYHLHRLCLMARALGCEPVRVAGRTRYFTLAVNYALREAAGVWRVRLLGPG